MNKLPAVIEYLRGCTGKTLVFAYHYDIIERLMMALADQGVSGFTGSSSLKWARSPWTTSCSTPRSRRWRATIAQRSVDAQADAVAQSRAIGFEGLAFSVARLSNSRINCCWSCLKHFAWSFNKDQNSLSSISTSTISLVFGGKFSTNLERRIITAVLDELEDHR
jgi:hypothetical protein